MKQKGIKNHSMKCLIFEIDIAFEQGSITGYVTPNGGNLVH